VGLFVGEVLCDALGEMLCGEEAALVALCKQVAIKGQLFCVNYTQNEWILVLRGSAETEKAGTTHRLERV